MTTVCRIDPHAHLYDQFCVEVWCRSAFRNLGGSSNVSALVVIVDRAGQDSFERLQREAPSFGTWSDIWEGRAGRITLGEGELTVVRGTQYVSSERIEVLALGAQRAAPDGMMASEYISSISAQGGIVCLPWSPGKWLGARGGVVRRVLESSSSSLVTVGDIALRSHFGPPSSLLRFAQQKGFTVLNGTDPLPRVRDQGLVGSFGVEVDIPPGGTLGWEPLRELLTSPRVVRSWGRRNSVVAATGRFLFSIGALPA